VTTVQGWKKRDAIPVNRRKQILEAADKHNIDLSDLFQTTHTAQAEEEVPAKAQKEENHISEPQKPAASVTQDKIVSRPHKAEDIDFTDDRPSRHEQLLAEIKKGDRKAVETSIWMTTVLIVVAIAVSAYLLWPTAQQVEENNVQISSLETNVQGLEEEVRDVNRRGSFLKDAIPEDIKAKYSELQEQAQTIQKNVQDLSSKADKISKGVLGEDAGTLSDRLAVLEEELNQMKATEDLGQMVGRIRELESSMAGQDQLQASLGELRTIVDSLDTRVSSLDRELSEAQGEDGALGQTLEGVSNDDLKAAAMLIAFSQMRDSLNREESFEDDLVLLQKMAGEDNPELQAALIRLAPHANGGVLSSEGLSKEFKGLAGDIIVSSIKGEDVSVKEKAKARLNELFQVKKDGELITGTDTQAKVARAQTLLDQGDIQAAIKELETLDGEAAQTAEPFIEQAEARLLAEQVQTMLRQTILSNVSGGFAASGGNVDLDLQKMQENFQNLTTPAQNGGGGVVKDEESGVVILPRQPGFKGLSTDQP